MRHMKNSLCHQNQFKQKYSLNFTANDNKELQQITIIKMVDIINKLKRQKLKNLLVIHSMKQPKLLFNIIEH